MDDRNVTRPDATREPASVPEGDGSSRQELRREIIEFGKMVAWFLVLFVVLRSFVIESCDVQGQSMHPTLHSNDRILVLKLPHLLARHWPLGEWNAIRPGDIVVFDSPDSKNVRYVKRVIAHGPAPRVSKAAQAADGAATAETVHVAVAEGAVYVNNQKVQEDYPHADAPAEKNGREADVYLNPGEYFVMGDNRRDSRDSRTFGPIRSECVIGKAVLRFWPLSQFGLL